MLLAGPVAAQPSYTPPGPGQKLGSFPDVKAELQAVQTEFEAGVAALNRQDNGAARDRLKKARQALEKALKTNPASRHAAEGLGMVYFYEGAAGDKGGYERSSKFLQKVVDADPDALQAPLPGPRLRPAE